MAIEYFKPFLIGNMSDKFLPTYVSVRHTFIIHTSFMGIPNSIKRVKNNTNFGQITGMEEKLDTRCK
jgi:hypothetical protein